MYIQLASFGRKSTKVAFSSDSVDWFDESHASSRSDPTDDPA